MLYYNGPGNKWNKAGWCTLDYWRRVTQLNSFCRTAIKVKLTSSSTHSWKIVVQAPIICLASSSSQITFSFAKVHLPKNVCTWSNDVTSFIATTMKDVYVRGFVFTKNSFKDASFQGRKCELLLCLARN